VIAARAACVRRFLASSPRQALGAAAYLLGVASLAVGLKLFYSQAVAEELRFVLAPTTWLVGGAFGCDFEFKAGAGYQSRELSILVSPACAGVNFLTIAFVSVALSLGAMTSTAKQRLVRLTASLGIAYGAAIAVNALRIIVSVLVARRAAHALGLSFQGVHRWIGVVLYVTALLGISALVSVWRSRVSVDPRPRPQSAMLVALACYVTVTIFGPFLRGAPLNPSWGEHALAVLSAVGICVLTLAIRRRPSLSSCAALPPAGRT
jgi:exosortase K